MRFILTRSGLHQARTAKRGCVSIKFGEELTDAAAKSMVGAGAPKEVLRAAFTSLAESQVRAHYAELQAIEEERLARV